jgi:hypothetical protein
MATNYTDLKGEIKAQIKPNGVGAITGQVLQDAMLNLVGATEAEMSALNAATDEKLAQLDQEWQGVKDQIEDSVLEVVTQVQPYIHKVVVEGGAAILEPDKLYLFGVVPQIALDFAPVADESRVAVYAFQFTSPADAATTITMPDYIKFPKESDSMFSIKANTTYQVNIVEGLAVATSWEV